MDLNETPETFDPESESFGKTLGKTFVASTASSAGVILGIFAGGYVVGSIAEYLKARKARKEQPVPTDQA